MSDAFDPREFLADFLIEAGEHLAALDEALLKAERLVGEGAPLPAELVNVLFRAIHTLKGMAGMMGFEATTAIAHAIEQIFDAVRQGARTLTPRQLGPIFAGQDALKLLMRMLEAEGSEDGVEVSEVLTALAVLDREGEPAGPARRPRLELLEPEDQMAVLVEAAKGQALYELDVRPADHCPEGLAAWLSDLGLIGRVAGMWDERDRPVAPTSEVAAVRLLFVTAADRPSLLDVTGVGEAAVRPVGLPWETRVVPAAAAPRPVASPGAGAAAPEKATSIRVETARLDRLMELVGELVIHQTQVSRLSGELDGALEAPGGLELQRERLTQIAASLDEALQSVGRVSDALQLSTMRVRMVPVKSLFQRFPRILRDLAVECGKQARLEMVGGDTELDRTVIEQIGDPLIHLIRNSIDHGLETAEVRVAAGKPAEGMVTLSASQEGHHIVLTIADDGAGIDRARVLGKAREKGLVGPDETPGDAEVLRLIFEPGFSTAAQITAISGRGVGMDVVHQNISRLGGSIQVLSEPGQGTRFVIHLPLTLAIAKALLVRAGAQTFVIPLRNVEETLRLRPDELKTVHGKTVTQVRGEVLPVFRLTELFGVDPSERSGAHLPMVVVSDGDTRMGLVVDAMVGQHDVVVKSLGDFLDQVSGVGGATILGDGRVALILDVRTLLERHAAAPLPL